MNLNSQAAECYKKALEYNCSTPVHSETRLRLGMIYKRNRQWDLAIQEWQKMIQTGVFSVQPYEELAKYYEHQARDYSAAIRWVAMAIDRIQIQARLQSDSRKPVLEHLLHRLERLRRKQRLSESESTV